MFYELANAPYWQEQLQTELDSVGFSEVPEYNDIRKLPILDALIHETLRLHPAAPASLQRITAEGGTIVDSIWIPGNVCDDIIL